MTIPKLTPKQSGRLWCDLLNQQRMADVVTDGSSEPENVWLNAHSRQKVLRTRRLTCLEKMDRLHEQGVQTFVSPKAASSDNSFVSVVVDDFRLDIQAVTAGQRLPGEPPTWILSLELRDAYCQILGEGDHVQVRDNEGRIWLQQPFINGDVLVGMWTNDISPVSLLGKVTLQLQVV